MPTNIPDTFYEAAFEHQQDLGSRPAVITLGLFYTGADVVTDFSQISNDYAARMMPVMCNLWTFTEARIRDGIGNVVTLPKNVDGGKAQPGASPQCAFLLRKITALGGRKMHGRMYLPGVNEQDIDAYGVVVGSKLTELTTQWNTFLGDMANSSFYWYLLHQGVTAPTPIDSYLWDTLSATQRRRLRK